MSQLQGVYGCAQSGIITKNCWRHTGLLDKHDDLLIYLTPAGMANVEEELGEIEKRISELVPARIRIAVFEFLTPGENEDCTFIISPEELIGSLADDVHNSIEDNEDSDLEVQSSGKLGRHNDARFFH